MDKILEQNVTPNRFEQYGPAVNTHDLLKILGVFLMIIDHIGMYFLPEQLWFRVLGRGAAPIFFFLIGYNGRLNCRWSLFLYGGILSVSQLWFYNASLWLNILYTFVLAQIFLQWIPSDKTPHNTKMVIFLLLVFCHFFVIKYLEYGTLGILIALTANWHRHKAAYHHIWLGFSLCLHFLWQLSAINFAQNENQLFGVIFIALFLWFIFSAYQLKTIKLPKRLNTLGLVLSRYSLEIYFFHLIGLQIIAFYIFRG